ncbi:hypothetical protein CC78DRAFT_434039, partial [Lojkania enalia]
SPFGTGPAPPRLPKEEQETFEQLQRQSTGAFSTPRPQQQTASQSPDSSPTSDIRARINQSPDSSPDTRTNAQTTAAESSGTQDDEMVHPNLRRGALPEFEGDRNPRTGEVGGPKNEPLRWGAGGDWSFNGRVTDF